MKILQTNIIKRGVILLFAFLLLGGTAGCWESDAENAAEDVVESVEDTADDAGDAIEDAAEEME